MFPGDQYFEPFPKEEDLMAQNTCLGCAKSIPQEAYCNTCRVSNNFTHYHYFVEEFQNFLTEDLDKTHPEEAAWQAWTKAVDVVRKSMLYLLRDPETEETVDER